MNPREPHRLLPVLIVGALALSACGDDGEPASSPTTAAAPAPAEEPEPAANVLEVVMDDFHYGDLPSEVPAGTRIVVGNASENEIHEFVAFRLPDDETRPVGEIVAGDLGPLLGGSEPATVLLAAPGGEMIPAVGDGTLAEPGRYLILCVIPSGVDPAEYLAAAAGSDGPPEVDGGPPHVANGMFAELTVTG